MDVKKHAEEEEDHIVQNLAIDTHKQIINPVKIIGLLIIYTITSQVDNINLPIFCTNLSSYSFILITKHINNKWKYGISIRDNNDNNKNIDV